MDILARMGARCEPVSQNTFLEWFFKPSIKWQGDFELSNQTEEPTPELITTPVVEPDDGIVGGSELEETSSAHKIMAVIAQWTVPLLAYLICKELPEDQMDARRIIR